MIVIDASVLTDYLLERHNAMSVVDRLLEGQDFEPLHAPEVVEPETVNALRKLSFRGHITTLRASQAVADLGQMRLIRHPHGVLRSRIWDLRDALNAYDAAYLALAEALGDGLLLTADRGLADVAGRLLGKDRVRTPGAVTP